MSARCALSQADQTGHGHRQWLVIYYYIAHTHTCAHAVHAYGVSAHTLTHVQAHHVAYMDYLCTRVSGIGYPV